VTETLVRESTIASTYKIECESGSADVSKRMLSELSRKSGYFSNLTLGYIETWIKLPLVFVKSWSGADGQHSNFY